MHEKHYFCFLLFLLSSSTEFLMGNGTWAVFDISSQEQDLVVVRFSLVKVRLWALSKVRFCQSRKRVLSYVINVF
jgi:hypothetical protein